MDTGGWRIIASADIRWREWDDETLVYNNESGDTHLLGPAETVLFRCLRNAPADIPELVRHLSSEFELGDDDDLFVYTDNLLDRLDHMGLAERVKP